MTYQTAYKLLVAAYKSAKGIMPEGIDLLKLKMKARQKVIDAKKVIQFPPERITNPFKARPPKQLAKYEGGGEGIKRMIEKGLIKIGEVTKRKKVKEPKSKKLEDAMESFFGFKPRRETEAEMLKRMNRQNKESVARLKEKKEKSLGEKLKDYDGDPDAMAGGGKVKKPFRSKVVDFLGGPSVVGAELGLSGLLEVYNLLGMPLMKDGGKVKKKRKHDDNIDEEDIGEGKSKERFLRVMPEVDDISRSDGIMELATGGMTNISDTYDNNPTLQSQYPNKQDYLDLFSSQTTTTTPEVAAIPETTTSTIAPINPIKPIIPIPQSDGDGGGGITTIDKGLTTADQYGFGPYGNNFNDPDVQDEIDALNPGGVKGFMQGLGNFYKTVSPFLNAKKALAKGQDFALDIIQKAKDAAAARAEAKLQAQRDRLTYSGPAFTNQDGSTISQDFSTPAGLSNYDADVLR